MTLRYLPLLAAVLALAGCSNKAGLQTKEAVRQGVIDHLSKRPNLDFKQMQVDVASVNFHGNLADAVVSFRPKGTAGVGNGMEMRYTLEQQGNRWVVKGRTDMSGAPHGGGMGQMPGGAMGQSPHGAMGQMPGSSAGAPQLPPDHPSIGGASPNPAKK